MIVVTRAVLLHRTNKSGASKPKQIQRNNHYSISFFAFLVIRFNAKKHFSSKYVKFVLDIELKYKPRDVFHQDRWCSSKKQLVE